MNNNVNTRQLRSVHPQGTSPKHGLMRASDHKMNYNDNR